MLWQKSRSCLKSFPWKTKAEWHLQLQKEQTPSHAELLPVSSEKCCSLILVQMRFRNCHCNPKYCNPLVLVFAGRSVVADDDCSTQWGLRAHTPWSLPSEPCVQADWKAAGWESCGFLLFLFIFMEGTPLVHPLAELFPAVQSQMLKEGWYILSEHHPESTAVWFYIFFFWVGVPWETSCNAFFLSLLCVGVLRGCWMKESVTLGWLL